MLGGGLDGPGGREPAFDPLDVRRLAVAQDALAGSVSALLRALGAPEGILLAISGASGAHAPTRAESAALGQAGDLAVRGFAGLTGHLLEAQFPFAVALAALAIAKGAPYPPFDPENEAPAGGAPEAAIATAVGFHRFEGAALLVAA